MESHLDASSELSHICQGSICDPLQLLEGAGQISKVNANFANTSFDNLSTASLYGALKIGNPILYSRDFVAQLADEKVQSPQPPEGDSAGAAPLKEVAESNHTVQKGETPETLARQKLGPDASDQQVHDYADAILSINNIDSKRFSPGTSIVLPGEQQDGTYTYCNPENQDEHWTWHPGGVFELYNSKSGTTVTHAPLANDPKGYVEEHKGPNKEDNFQVVYVSSTGDMTVTKKDGTRTVTDKSGNYKTVNPDGSTVNFDKASGQTIWVDTDLTKTVQDRYGNYKMTYPNGSTKTYDKGRDETTEIGVDGSRKVTDKNGNYVQTKPGNLTVIYDKSKDTTTTYTHDKCVSITYNQDGHSEVTSPDGTKTTKYPDGSFVEEHKDKKGHVITRTHRLDHQGGYTEVGSGPNPKDNYDETYDSQTGITVRTEARGTAQEKMTTRTRDGVISEVANNEIRVKSDLPQNYTQIERSKAELNEAAKNHIPADKQAQFKDDMDAFEKRAKEQNMPPEEVARTYEQMARMLNAKDKESATPAANRALLAESFLHQCAHPDETDQGSHQTCNVTTVAERGFRKHPDKLAEIAATTAITGHWVAPDGKVIKIDKDSLKPGAEEKTYPPERDGGRTYATQILNVAMINDCTQRRHPPEYYHQGTTTGSAGQSGEYLTDSSGKIIREPVYGPHKGKSSRGVVHEPMIAYWEIAQSAQRLFGEDAGTIIGARDAGASVESVNSPQALVQRVQQAQDQGTMPLIIDVDGNHKPIVDDETPGYGGHVVTIDDYNSATGQIHISNEWGKASDKWVSPEELYKNSAGDYSQGDANLPPLQLNNSDLNLPSTWNRREEYTLFGHATTFAPEDQSAEITVLEHANRLSSAPEKAYSELLIENIKDPKVLYSDSTTNDADANKIVKALSEVLGTTRLGDNQISNPKTHKGDHEPAFHLQTAQLENINGKNVLAVSGWFTQNNEKGKPKTDANGPLKRYYTGIFAPADDRASKVLELYLLADTDTAFNKAQVQFDSAVHSIK